MAAPETLREAQAEAEAPAPLQVIDAETPTNISDAWVARPVQKQTGAPVALTLVPTPELVSTVLEETGAAPSEERTPLTATASMPESALGDEELTQLLGRLDETLGLIRGLRAQAS